MPGAPRFRYQLHNVAVLKHHIMRRHFGGGMAQLVNGSFVVAHPGVMQDDHVRQTDALALVVVWRRPHLCDDAGIWAQLGHKHSHTREPHGRTRYQVQVTKAKEVAAASFR